MNVELTLIVTAPDESTAARLAETLARTQVGMSAEEGVEASLYVARYVCDHQHGEVGP